MLQWFGTAGMKGELLGSKILSKTTAKETHLGVGGEGRCVCLFFTLKGKIELCLKGLFMVAVLSPQRQPGGARIPLVAAAQTPPPRLAQYLGVLGELQWPLLSPSPPQDAGELRHRVTTELGCGGSGRASDLPFFGEEIQLGSGGAWPFKSAPLPPPPPPVLVIRESLVIGEIEEVVKLDLHTNQELCQLCECGL